MFDGIKLKTLLSTPEEWHALVIGFFEVLCPWPARYKVNRSVNKTLATEYHYYATGRGIGFVIFIFIIIFLTKLALEVLL